MHIEVIKSRRKSMALQLKNAEHLIVRVPLRTSQRSVKRFLENHRNWIGKQQQRLLQHPGLPENDYRDGGFIWLVGERYKISVRQGKRNITRQDDNTLVVSNPKIASETVTRQIQQWQRHFATQYFLSYIKRQYQEFPQSLPAYSFSVRQMRRQWGNCSRDGHIKLSLNLIRYPEACIKHVIYHELCHLVHFNHSHGFYRLLEQVEPNWKEQKTRLSTFSG